MDIKLSLMTGADIPIPECQMTLRQPTIKEIGMIGEKDFFMGAQCLCLNKTMYVNINNQQELDQISNFQIFIMIINDKNMVDKKNSVKKVLNLIFPSYNFNFTPRSILVNSNEGNFIIDEGNFQQLQNVLSQVFCLGASGQEAFNPGSEKAREIADKLMRARQRVAAQQNQGSVGKSVFAQYLSILAVGISSMSLLDLINLTQYQLYDLIERYMLYVNWDLDIKTRLAGGKPDSKPDNWMKELH